MGLYLLISCMTPYSRVIVLSHEHINDCDTDVAFKMRMHFHFIVSWNIMHHYKDLIVVNIR